MDKWLEISGWIEGKRGRDRGMIVGVMRGKEGGIDRG
jgi:hypothetical protein